MTAPTLTAVPPLTLPFSVTEADSMLASMLAA